MTKAKICRVIALNIVGLLLTTAAATGRETTTTDPYVAEGRAPQWAFDTRITTEVRGIRNVR